MFRSLYARMAYDVSVRLFGKVGGRNEIPYVLEPCANSSTTCELTPSVDLDAPHATAFHT